MFQAFSCILTKDKKVLTCKNPNMLYYDDILKDHNIETVGTVNMFFVKAKLYPKDGDYTSNVDNWAWAYTLQYDSISGLHSAPDWLLADEESYTDICREAAKKWQEICVDEDGKYIVECSDGTKKWYKDDKLHRDDGPAIEYANGYKEYWLNGDPVKEKDVIKE